MSKRKRIVVRLTESQLVSAIHAVTYDAEQNLKHGRRERCAYLEALSDKLFKALVPEEPDA